jgi:SAM-dependent methyltransferase
MKIRALLMSSLLLVPQLVMCETKGDTQQVFSRIYGDGVWGRNSDGEGISGVGSIYENARPYVKLLQKFLKTHQIKSVVDVGCGDWELSKYIQWGDIKYIGYDVVSDVIEKDTAKYGSSQFQFICGDGVNADLPEADLLICKDVLQHLPNSYIHTLISKMKRFKYCLITNDISAPSVPHAHRRVNIDIPIGSGRFVDLTKNPFNIKAKTLLTYTSPGTVKRVVLVCLKDQKEQR